MEPEYYEEEKQIKKISKAIQVNFIAVPIKIKRTTKTSVVITRGEINNVIKYIE